MIYLLKLFFKFVFLVLGFILLVVLIINAFLITAKDKVDPFLNKYVGQRLSAESINYFPPNFIILSNVSIFRELPSNQPFFIKNIVLVFSPRELINKRAISFRKIYLNGPKVISSKGTPFLEENIEQVIIETIDFLNRQPSLEVIIRNALLVSPREEDPTPPITINTTLKVESGFLSSSGSIGFENFPLNYSFKGNLIKEGIFIENLEFKGANFYSTFWGRLERNVLKLNGFSSLSDFSTLSRTQEISVKIIDRLIKFLERKDTPAVEMKGLSAFVLNIFDFDCVIKLVPQRVQIENLNFSLNKNLIEVKGYLEGKRFNGEVSLDFSKKAKEERFAEKIDATFKDLVFYSDQDAQLKLSSKELALSLMVDTNLYTIFLENFNARFDLKDEKFKLLKFDSMLYGGFLEGEGIIKTSLTPLRSNFNLKIKDISVNKLSSLFVYFPKVDGKLSGQIYYQNYPRSNLKGGIRMVDGYLDDLDFFNWLADFFILPSLTKVNFDELSTDFFVSDEVSGLEKISLNSKDVKFAGHFNLYENDLVSGRLSLTLSRELAKKSPNLRRLLRLLSKDVPGVNFDFQLSGLFDSMNFKWLESDFKKKVKKLLPRSMERGIEKELEEAIGSISPE